MKDELVGKVMKRLIGLRTKTCSYLTGNNDEDKKAKDTKQCVVEKKVNFDDYKNHLEQLNLKIK